MTARTRCARSVLALVLAGLGPAEVRAQSLAEKVEMSTIDVRSLLDLSVEVVTRRPELASRAPATVFVLTADDIRRNGFRTVQEALGSVPGLFSYPGYYPQIGVRGMGIMGDLTTRLLILVDGHEVNTAGGVELGRGFPVPLAAVERIEVIEGPVGSVYGPTAFLGVVNLVTIGGKPFTELKVGGELAQGAVRAGDGSVVWRANGDVEFVTAADLHFRKGQDWTFPELASVPISPTVATGGKVVGLDRGDAGRGYARARWRGLEGAISCSHAYGGIPFGTYMADRRTVLESRVCFAEIGIKREVSDGLTLKSRIAYDDLDKRAALVFPETPPFALGVYEHEGYDRHGTAEVRAEWQATEWGHLDVGATGQVHRVRQYSHSRSNPLIRMELAKPFQTLNTWIMGEAAVGHGVTLHGGVTFFAHSLFNSRLTPKLAAVWQPTPADTVKAIWSMGFRPPTYVEALLQDDFSYVANPGLKAETVSSVELAYEHRFAELASIRTSLFWNEYRDLIRAVPVPAPGVPAPDPANPSDWRQQNQNAERLRVLGGELALRVRWRHWLEGFGGIGLQHPSHADRANFPRVTANLSASSRALWRPLLMTVRGTVVSAREKPSLVGLGSEGSVPSTLSLAANTVLDVPGVKGLQVELAVVNLLDNRNVSPVVTDLAPLTELPEAARTVRADLRWRF